MGKSVRRTWYSRDARNEAVPLCGNRPSFWPLEKLLVRQSRYWAMTQSLSSLAGDRAQFQWSLGQAPPALPHCRHVELIHVPKTSGQAILSALDRANVSFCFTETYCNQGGLQRIGGRQPCGCRHCSDSASLETIGVHERRFGAEIAGYGNPSTLYLAIVREPISWLKSVVAHTCREEHSLPECQTGQVGNWYQGLHHRHSAPYRLFSFVTWYHTPDLQSHMLDGVFAAKNWVICTLEHRETIMNVLEVATDSSLSHKMVRNARSSQNHEDLPRNFTSDVEAGQYSHLYHMDAALYEHITRAGGCVHRLGDKWSQVLRQSYAKNAP